jgi:hypothetical protein
MHDDKHLKLYGLSRRQAATLAALFQAVSAGELPPRWVSAAANRPALTALARAGLVSQARLTLSGLAVAVSLPTLRRCRWPEAA